MVRFCFVYKIFLLLCDSLFSVILCDCETKLERTTTECEYFNETCAQSAIDGQQCSIKKEECEKPDNGKRNHCYVLWTDDENGKVKVQLKANTIAHSLV